MGHGWHGCFWADSKQWGNSNTPAANASSIIFPIAFTKFYKIIATGNLTMSDSVFTQTVNYLTDYGNELSSCFFRTSGIDKPACSYITIGI